MNTTTKRCPWCCEDILASAKICHYCGRDENKFWGTLQRLAPIGLVAAVFGVLIATWLAFESAGQAREERVKAEHAATRAEEALAVATSSQEIAIGAQADAKRITAELRQLIADADERKNEIVSLIDQSSQSDKQIHELAVLLNTLRVKMASANQEVSQFSTNLETRFSGLQKTSQDAADVLYAGEMSANIAEILRPVRASVRCDVAVYNAQATEPRSARCLGEILHLRSRMAEAVVHSSRYREEMTREVWEKSTSTKLCYRLESLTTGHFSVSLIDYLENKTWRSWAGYASETILLTKPYIEDNSDLLAQCQKFDGPGIDASALVFVPRFGRFIDFDGVESVEINVPDEGIVIFYRDEIQKIYEWQLDEEPRIRIIKRTPD